MRPVENNTIMPIFKSLFFCSSLAHVFFKVDFCVMLPSATTATVFRENQPGIVLNVDAWKASSSIVITDKKIGSLHTHNVVVAA